MTGEVLFYAEPTEQGNDRWTLRCDHGAVRSDEITRTFTVDLVLGAYLYWALELDASLSDEVVALVATQTLLGRLAELRWGCDCGLRPYVLGALLLAADEGPRQ